MVSEYIRRKLIIWFPYPIVELTMSQFKCILEIPREFQETMTGRHRRRQQNHLFNSTLAIITVASVLDSSSFLLMGYKKQATVYGA